MSPESSVQPAPRLHLLDVEGTVAPISLVSEQLFPYARTHFESFLWKTLADPERDFSEGSVFRDVMMLGLESKMEEGEDVPRIFPDVANVPGLAGEANTVSMSPGYAIPRILAYVNWLMDRDRKSTALKSLQGKIWKAGFESGQLKGTLFEDVPAALRLWASHAQVAIYSSGSVEAQQLLFRYSTFGDLTGLIAAYFDTRTGPKAASASYAAIAEAMKVEPGEAIFFSDVVRELDAAREAGCQTRLVMREGNAPIDDPHGHIIINSFDGTL
jgi:enolase-phosphatase E1